MSATLSPDGRYVASFSFGAGGRQDVVLRAVETGAAQRSFDIVSVPLMLGFTPTGDALTFLESRKGPRRSGISPWTAARHNSCWT